MQITHEEAHRLIQFDADDALKPYEKSNLVEHLQFCAECQTYAKSIRGIELLLRPLLQKNWNKEPPPLSVASVIGKRNQEVAQGAFLATRIAVIGMICMVFLFSVWQFSVSGETRPTLSVASIPPMPTPSVQFVNMTSTSSSCTGTVYRVKEEDTIEGIAQRYAVSKEDILTANNLSPAHLKVGMEVVIPTCTSTPTGTLNAPTSTNTPSTKPTTSTPGG
jgi:hypothetical protein